MRVALLSAWSLSDDAIGGTERFVLDLARLLARDHEVTVASLGTVALPDPEIQTRSVRIVPRLDERTLWEHVAAAGLTGVEAALRAALGADAFDVVHCNSLLFAGMLPGSPAVHTVHSNREEFRALFPPRVAAGILRRIARDAHATYVAPSEAAAASFVLLTGRRVAVIPHATVPRLALRRRAALRRRYGIPAGSLVLCVPSRLDVEQKGQDTLLGALRTLGPTLPRSTVVLGGCDAQYRRGAASLRRAFPDLHLVIEGFANASDMYSLADAVVLPSRTESFGYAALESATLGLPTFVSDIPPFREIARGNPGIIPFVNDVPGLARTLAGHRDLLRARRTLPPPHAWLARYAGPTMLRRYLACYRAAIAAFHRDTPRGAARATPVRTAPRTTRS